MRRGGDWRPALGPILLGGTAINFAWEMAQMRLFGRGVVPAWGGPILGCLVAALLDGMGIAAIYGSGIVLFRSPNWVCRPGGKGWLLTLGLGLIGATMVERTALALGWWSYGPAMPLVPGLSVGLSPLLQSLLLAPVVLFLAACRWVRKRCSEPQ